MTAKAIPARFGEELFRRARRDSFLGGDQATSFFLSVCPEKRFDWFCRFGKRFYFCTHCPPHEGLRSGDWGGQSERDHWHCSYEEQKCSTRRREKGFAISCRGCLPPRWGGPIYRLLLTKPSLDEDIYSVKEKNEKTEREKETEVYYLINRIIQRVIIGVWARKTEANKHTNMTVESLILAQDER